MAGRRLRQTVYDELLAAGVMRRWRDFVSIRLL
jgi:hypothetical protein